MTDAAEFGRVVLIVAVGFAVAILSSRISGRLRVPAPALFLAAATVSSDLIPNLAPLLTIHDVERICLVALIVILFDGGMDIGVARFRESLWPIVSLGVVGTFLVAGLLAVLVHALFGPSWTTSLLIGAALAPTDPAVVFSVLGGSEVSGRSDDILKGESGVNDPVGIALVIGLLDIATSNGSSVAIAEDFVLQMAVGLAVGVIGGLALGRAMRDLMLPDSALYPLLTLSAAGIVYGLASVLHGSGFLAVFVTGVLIADLRAPYKAEIEHFHKALASLGEIVVFVALGLTIDLGSLDLRSVWLDGLAVAVLLDVRGAAAGGGGIAGAGTPDAGREGVHRLGRHARRGADPAGRVHAAGGRRPRQPHLRDRVRGRDVLGGRAGLAGADGGRPGRPADAADPPGAVGPVGAPPR